MKNTCQLRFELKNPRTISGTVFFEEIEKRSEILTFHTPKISEHYLFPWLIELTKEVYRLPLSASINIKLLGEKSFFDPLLPIFQSMVNIIQNTRKAIATHRGFSQKTASFKGKLFLNLGDVPFLRNLYEQAYAIDPDNTHYDICNFLNDIPIPESEAVSLERLISFILTNKIGTIYTHNISYLMYFLSRYQIHLPPLFKSLGIHLIIVDFDIYSEREGEYLLKKMMNTDEEARFSIYPHTERYWDRELNIKNVHYHPIPYTVKESKTRVLREDYEILVTTWARTPHIIHFLKPILLFLNYVDPEKPFYDFQFLFHAMTHYLTQHLNIPLHQKMRFFTLLSEVYFHTNSLMKFEILQKIQTRRPIHLYGQKDWNDFFPQYYKGQADQNDLSRMLDEKPFLQLLLNSNYNYFENNPMFIRLLNSGNPYLGFSSILKTEDLRGLEALEFSSIAELNSKIDQVNLLTQSENYQNSKQALSCSINLCTESFYQEVLTPPLMRSEDKKNIFEITTDHYQKMFENEFAASFPANRARIEECLLKILKEDFHHLNPSASPLADRPYFQKIITLYEESQAGK